MVRLARVAVFDDPMGRRIVKEVDGTTETKYVYDGNHCIAEYDANDALLRKFIHGPAVDEPICMIEVADSNATYYYHFDALGSVVALTDADANAVQLYEYSVYGQVAASDPNHTNPFLFTGRRFDADTGLYYYRARYYSPYIGRFLQTDPIGYGAGMNLYAYCGNCAPNGMDPYGLRVRFTNDGWERLTHDHFPGIGSDPYELANIVKNLLNSNTPSIRAPYFVQHLPASCVAAAILNASVTRGIAPLDVKSPERLPFTAMEHDFMAEDWVLTQLKQLNPKGEGMYRGFTLKDAQKVLGEDAWEYSERQPWASEIRRRIDRGKTVIIGIDLNVHKADTNGDNKYDEHDQVWHAVTIVKSPENAGGGFWDPGKEKYSVLDPLQEYGQPQFLTAEAFDAWFRAYDVHNAWLCGPGER